jgi:hypothetical protein
MVIPMRDSENSFVVYRCTDCGKKSLSLGYLHGHIEGHQGWGPWNVLPDPRKIGNPDALDERVEELHVSVDEVKARAE